MPSSTAPGPVVAAARIRYEADQPYSLDYQDIYHAADGAAEVARVFIEPCRLDELARERAARAGPARVVRVGELGFGSGLNFVVAAERCLAAGAALHFVSCEAHPLDAGDFARIAQERGRRHPLYAELAERYPPRVHGWHQRVLAGGRVRLNLWLGDAADALADLAERQRQPLDAWFLDGFAPDRNPALWQPELFARVAALSAAGTRIATFTSAGRVRRGLEAAGFTMRRVDQRPHKRESLAGTFARPGLAGFQPPERVTVAGGGIAGAAVAAALARAGCRVRLLEPGHWSTAGEDAAEGLPEPVPETAPEGPPASRMPVTVLHARLLPDATPAAAWRCHAYLHAADRLKGLPGFRATGALQAARDPADAERLCGIAAVLGGSGPWLRWLDVAAATDVAGWPVPHGGLLLPDGGTVDLPALIGGLLRDDNVEIVPARLESVPKGPLQSGPVVLACGAGTRAFAPARYLELAPVQGQLDFVRTEERPRLPLVGRGYLAPAADGLLAAGSTYEHRAWDPQEATRANLRQLEGRRYEWCHRRRGTRSVSSDRAAVAGPLFDLEGRPVPGLFVTTGHGSAGNATAQLVAAVITAHVLGDCPPLTRAAEVTISPARFRERQARRGYRHDASG